jgi:uncharacterized protein (TIGR02118 family)
MSDEVAKFMLVVAGDGIHDEFIDRLTRHMAGLPGTSLTHVALPRQPEEADPEPAASPASVIVEWFAAEPPVPTQWADALSIDVGRLNWYAVSEALRWHRPGTNRSSATGISHICCVGRSSGLTESQFEQHWTQVHRPLAQKHHAGMELYVQSVVRSQLGSSGSGIDGIAELGFPSVESFQTEMYDSDEGLGTIRADVSTFVGTASCGLYRLVSG